MDPAANMKLPGCCDSYNSEKNEVTLNKLVLVKRNVIYFPVIKQRLELCTQNHDAHIEQTGKVT